MKKHIVLVTLLALASFTFAQQYVPYAPVKESQKFQKQTTTTKAEGDVIWSVTFEETTPVWTIAEDDPNGETLWVIGDQNDAPTLWEPSPGSFYFQYLGEYSETGNTQEGGADGHWAWIDIISSYPGFGGAGQTTENSWIQFDNIDLTGVQYPKLSFYQLIRPLNAVGTYLDFSTDGGSNWTSIEINSEVQGNEYGDVVFEKIVAQYIANESNVSIRFRWVTSDPSTVVGYGWQIDDIKIVENPNYDLKLVDARMNFFEYIDYTEPGQADYFHASSHYGQIPNEQFEQPLAAMWFNVMVENKGNFAATPDVNVTVLDPLGNQVYNETVSGTVLAVAEMDTVDLIETDFVLEPGFSPGEYNVLIEVTEDGQTDFNESDNTFTIAFNVTDNIMARDQNNITGQTGPSTWLNGGIDGDMLGTTYLFLYDTEIESMWVYIGDRTDANTNVVAHVMEYSAVDEDWVDMATSNFYTITETDIDGWVEFTFPDPIIIEIPDGEEAFQVLAALEFYYGSEENEIMIGTDRSAPASFWGASWYFMEGTNAQQWFSITNWAATNLAIRLQTSFGDDYPVAIFSADATDIFVGEEVAFINQSLNADEFAWTFEGGDPATSTDENPVVVYLAPGLYNVTLVVTNTSTGTTDTRLIEDYIFVLSTFVSPASTENFNVYPNPATDVITVEANDITRMRVMNSLGQIVFESNDNSVNTIDVSSWNGGWYILEVTSGSEIIRTNVIVK
jgi:PKD repeat protein